MTDAAALFTSLTAAWATAIWRACWQGGIAILIAGAICRLSPRLPARFRCWLWRLAHLKLFVALLWAIPLNLPILPQTERAAESYAPIAEKAGKTIEAMVPSSSGPPSGPTVNPINTPGTLLRAILFCLWLAGCGAGFVRIGRDNKAVRRLRRSGLPSDDPTVLQESVDLCDRMRLKRRPDILLLPEEDGPLLVGILHPAILLPRPFWGGCTPVQRRLILAHELAHLQRGDLLWAWLPGLARCFFFFHPLVWYAEREWELSQESACDEQALRLPGVTRAEYGNVLLKVILQPHPISPTGFAALCAAESYISVRKRLLAMKQIRAMSRGSLLLTGSLLGALGLVGIVPWRVSAQETANNEKPRVQLTTEELLITGEMAQLLNLSEKQHEKPQMGIATLRGASNRKVRRFLTAEQYQLLNRQREILSYDRFSRATLDRMRLTEGQKDRIHAIREDRSNQLNALASDRSLPIAEKVNRSAVITKTAEEKCTSLLTPDQQAQFSKLRDGIWNLIKRHSASGSTRR